MKQKHRLQTRGGRLRTDRSPGGADDDKLTSHRTKRVKSESVDWFKQSVRLSQPEQTPRMNPDRLK